MSLLFNVSVHFSLIDVFAFQGSNAVRPILPPEELVFTVDNKVRCDIRNAKQQYLESVRQ